MGRSVRGRSLLFPLLLLAGLSLPLCVACWAAAKLTLDAPLALIGLFSAFAIAVVAGYRQHELLRRRNAELREQNLRLQGAVNNITQALLMFDFDGRLVLCNDRYREMYGLP